MLDCNDKRVGAKHGLLPGAIQGLPLSRREAEVLESVACGLTNKEIGCLLGLTEATIKVYVRQMMLKLDLRNRVELTLWHYKLLAA